MPRLLQICLLLVCGSMLSIHIQAVEVRTTAQDSQPKYVLSGSTMTGLCPDIWRAIQRQEPQLRVSLRGVFTPLARIELQLERGEIDAFCGLARTGPRLEHMEFLLPPIYASNSVLAARIDESHVIQSWDDLRGLNATVLVTANSIHAKALADMPGISIDAGAQDTSQNLQKLLAGRGRFILHNDFALANEIQRDGLGDKIKVLPTPLFTESRYIVVSRTADPAIKGLIAAALLAMQKSGELERIYSTYSPH